MLLGRRYRWTRNEVLALVRRERKYLVQLTEYESIGVVNDG